MKLENQVVNLELAKQLKELGVKQESLFYWNVRTQDDNKNINLYTKEHCGKILDFQTNELLDLYYSAFTSSELGEMLPDLDPIAKSGDIESSFSSTKLGNSGYWTCGYGNKKVFIQEETEANARAKCLTYLIKNKLI